MIPYFNHTKKLWYWNDQSKRANEHELIDTTETGPIKIPSWTQDPISGAQMFKEEEFWIREGRRIK